MSPVSTPRETELKFELDPSDVGKLTARLRRIGGAELGIDRLTSVYYDTAKHRLRSGGLTLRIRTVGERRIQTVKASAGIGVGLFERDEWETDVASDEPDLKAAAKTPVADRLGKAAKPLISIFETVVDRHLWSVVSDRAEIELALDEGQVVAGPSSQPFAELELELKRGAPGDLFDLVKQLGDVSSLRLGVLTKSERGYRLLDGRNAKPSKAEPVALERSSTTTVAFQVIVRSCLRQFRLNEPLVVATRQAEALHQMRVAMRRLRSALSLFQSVVADDTSESLASRLQTASRQFGEARNLDVYLATVVEPETEGTPEPGAPSYRAQVEKRRAAAYDRAIRTLRSRAFRALMIDLMAWIEAGPWLTAVEPAQKALREQPIERFAAQCLGDFRRKIKKSGRHLGALDPHHRHRVRIKAKKLRYAADFFAGLVGKRKRRRQHGAFVEALADLQQHLGDLNDIQTAHTIADDLARGAQRQAKGDPALALLAAGHATGLQDAKTDQLLDKAQQAYRTFAAAKPFWSSWASE